MDKFIGICKQFAIMVLWVIFMYALFTMLYAVLIGLAGRVSGYEQMGAEVIEILFCAMFICVGGVYGGIFWGSRDKRFLESWKSIPKTEIPSDIARPILAAQWGAAFIGAMTIGVWVYFYAGNELEKMPFVNIVSLFNGIVPLFFAYGIYRKSRVCIVLMLVNFTLGAIGKYYGDTSSWASSGVAMSLFFIGNFAFGVLGMFKFHKWLNERNSAIVRPSEEKTEMELASS